MPRLNLINPEKKEQLVISLPSFRVHFFFFLSLRLADVIFIHRFMDRLIRVPSI